MSHLLVRLATGLLLVLGLGVLAAGRTLRRRLRMLEQAVLRLGEGELTARVDPDLPGPIGSLGRQFNQMAGRLQEVVERQQHLLQAVAHELRTPLARLGFGLEMLSACGEAREKARRLQEIGEELREMDQLIGELLLFTRFDLAWLPLERQPIPLAPALGEAIARFADADPGIALELGAGARADLTVTANQVFFRRALLNLLANAVRHARTTVALGCDRSAAGVAIHVDDDGPGVPAEVRPRIFEPFYRLDGGRIPGAGGTGLGLAIVRRIMELHGGQASVGDSPLGGARFTLSFPAAPVQTG